MNHLEIIYSPLPFGTLKLETPSSWEELNQSQLKAVAENYLLLKSGHQWTRAKIFRSLVEPKPWQLRKLLLLQLIPDEVISEVIMETTEFIYSSLDRTTNPFPSIRIGKTEFFGPMDHFDDFSMAEFESADVFSNSFATTHSPESLDHLCGCLYRTLDASAISSAEHLLYGRPPKVRFRAEHVDRLASYFKGVPLWKKVVIYLFYQSWRLKLVGRYQQFFSAPPAEGSPAPASFHPLVVQLCRGSISEKERIYQTPVEEVMRTIAAWEKAK